MFKSRFTLVAMGIMLGGFQQPVLSSPLPSSYTECNGCNDIQSKQSVIIAVQKQQELVASQDVHVVDIEKRTINSFKVNPIDTPTELQAVLDDYIAARQTLYAQVSNVVIPSSLFTSVWEFINCAYCKNDVESFINQQPELAIDQYAKATNRLVNQFDLSDAPILKSVEIQFESGDGARLNLALMIDVASKSYQISVEMPDVWDSNGNIIPPRVDGLANLKILVADQHNETLINEYLGKRGFHTTTVPGLRDKVRIIRLCSDPQCSDS